MKFLSATEVRKIILRALSEDQVRQDMTTKGLISETLTCRASVTSKASGVVAGTEIARQVFLEVDPKLKITVLIHDGTKVRPGDVIATVEGKCTSILKAERVALNFLQRLSGIASETARYVQAVKGLPVIILDTRKTTPGLRTLEKYAVRAGGGHNHRMNLSDGILIKDNHIAILRRQNLGLGEIIDKARQKAPAKLKLEIEVKTADEAAQAAEAGADIILLDNMNPEQMREAVGLVKGRSLLEASGGITLENVRTTAGAGVDRISIGALTHSPKALDISLEF